MKRELCVYPDPVLCKEAEAVGEITPALRQLAKDMAETMYANQGIGLAAPQVGECCRLIVVDVSEQQEGAPGLMAIVNPVVCAAEGEIDYEEGCLSVRDYRAKVRRNQKVTVRGKDLDGQDVEVTADGLLAICLQHEIDHLDGKLFIDRISRLKRSMYDRKVHKWQKKSSA